MPKALIEDLPLAIFRATTQDHHTMKPLTSRLREKPATPLAFTSVALLAACNGNDNAITPVEVIEVPLTGDNLLDAMLEGSKYAITAPIGYAIAPGLMGEMPLDTEAEATALAHILDGVETYTNATFENLGIFESFDEAREAGATIILMSDRGDWFYKSEFEVDVVASGHFPDDGPIRVGGRDVFVNGVLLLNQNDWAGDRSKQAPEVGNRSYSIRAHELGHVLGMKHPHDGQEKGRPTFEEINFEGFDDFQYTLMSYNNLFGANAEGGYLNHPETYMPFDILALMYLYGINGETNSGDNVYLVETTSNRTSIWDAGGNDTIDASLVMQDLKIFLPYAHPMKTIDVAVGLVENAQALVDPFIIWMLGDIENAYGGSGNDLLKGNALDNRIVGGNGEDILIGGTGDDLLVGGGGADIFILGLGDGTDRIVDFEIGVDQVVFVGAEGWGGDEPAPEAALGADADGNATFTLADGAMIIVENIDPSAFALVA